MFFNRFQRNLCKSIEHEMTIVILRCFFLFKNHRRMQVLKYGGEFWVLIKCIFLLVQYIMFDICVTLFKTVIKTTFDPQAMLGQRKREVKQNQHVSHFSVPGTALFTPLSFSRHGASNDILGDLKCKLQNLTSGQGHMVT